MAEELKVKNKKNMRAARAARDATAARLVQQEELMQQAVARIQQLTAEKQAFESFAGGMRPLIGYLLSVYNELRGEPTDAPVVIPIDGLGASDGKTLNVDPAEDGTVSVSMSEAKAAPSAADQLSALLGG